jgi:hypothetical protein
LAQERLWTAVIYTSTAEHYNGWSQLCMRAAARQHWVDDVVGRNGIFHLLPLLCTLLFSTANLRNVLLTHVAADDAAADDAIQHASDT